MKYEEFINDREIHEECGVFGIYNVPNAAEITYYALHSLQHRGQEGCGIVACDENKKFTRKKGPGLVTEVFKDSNLKDLAGTMAIGHCKYANADAGGEENIQPLVFNHQTGHFAVCHNGSLVNAKELKLYLEQKGFMFQTKSDSEILAYLVKKTSDESKRIHNIIEALSMMEGSFAFVIMSEHKIYAMRDKYGFRPLAIGQIGDGYVVSSETCAFEVINAKYVRDVNPGEVIVIDENGVSSYDYSNFKRHYMCAMEYIYFARPDSDIEECNVHTFRKESGKILARETAVDADIVIGVPDSSLSTAIGYAEASGIPYEIGLIKNKYVGRTFIQPSQDLRERGVKMKLSAVSSIVKGKRVVLVDDSIVRGTTSKRIVNLLREAGATEVHVRIGSPQIINPCFYGVDMSTYDELISAQKTLEEIRVMINADTLCFMQPEQLLEAGRRDELCMACFNGKYPTALYQSIEEANKGNS